jgi:hypothetical protein
VDQHRRTINLTWISMAARQSHNDHRPGRGTVGRSSGSSDFSQERRIDQPATLDRRLHAGTVHATILAAKPRWRRFSTAGPTVSAVSTAEPDDL